MHDDLDSLLLMEDGALVHRGMATSHWKQVHGIEALNCL